MTPEQLCQAADFNEKYFQDWLQRDETKMILSVIPASGNNDLFLSLFRAAYKSGYLTGQTILGISLLKDVIERKANG